MYIQYNINNLLILYSAMSLYIKTIKKLLRPKKSDYSLTVKSRRRSKAPSSRDIYLKLVCPNATDCIGFGKETLLIDKYFDYFTNFNLAERAERVGEKSKNGFILKLDYLKNGYSASCILKSANENTHTHISDNLMYEWFVGMFINKFCSKFTCFLKTYGLFKYTNKEHHAEFASTQVSIQTLKELQLQIEPSNSLNSFIKLGCKYSYLLCMLVQYVNGITLSALLELKKNDEQFINYDLWCILFQVYHALSELRNVFTHGDLHCHNIMVLEPLSGSYITYNYYINDQLFSFKTRYVAKIIDLGRAYFNDFPEISSDAIYASACNNCTKCGYDSGFYKKKRIKNVSRDLWSLSLMFNYLGEKNINMSLPVKNLISSVVYSDETRNVEKKESGKLKGKIYNVSDAADAIGDIIQANKNTKYDPYNYYPYKYVPIGSKDDTYKYSEGQIFTIRKGRDVQIQY